MLFSQEYWEYSLRLQHILNNIILLLSMIFHVYKSSFLQGHNLDLYFSIDLKFIY